MLKSCSVEQAVVGRLVGSRVLYNKGKGSRHDCECEYNKIEMPRMTHVSKESILTTRGEGAFEGLKLGLLVEGATVGFSEGLGVGCNGLLCKKHSSASKQS